MSRFVLNLTNSSATLTPFFVVFAVNWLVAISEAKPFILIRHMLCMPSKSMWQSTSSSLDTEHQLCMLCFSEDNHVGVLCSFCGIKFGMECELVKCSPSGDCHVEPWFTYLGFGKFNITLTKFTFRLNSFELC